MKTETLKRYLSPVDGCPHLGRVKRPLEVYKKVYLHKFTTRKDSWTGIPRQVVTVVPSIAVLRLTKGTLVRFNYHDVKTKKMRANRATVVQLFTRWAEREIDLAHSGHDASFKYKLGKVVRPKHGFSKRYDECAGGIHFFASITQARAWRF